MKNTFSKEEYETLKVLISNKEKADKEEQKKIRRKIRNIGFHFSKYSSKKGYTVADFENLIRNGNIKITARKKIVFDETKLSKRQIIKVSNQKVPDITNLEFIDFVDLDRTDLEKTGIYFIRLKKNSKLPKKYQKIIDKRDNNLIYIGIAKGQSLKQRLDQEVYHKKPGTFFRSIGAVLQFTPIPGHLKNKANKKNYKFSATDTEKITNWLLANTEFTILPITDNFKIEKDLIEKYCPLLNHSYNPSKLPELILERENCRSIAKG
ncbi:GIY-YIG nuclease family protein [uncultured Christiangramia sp.]|uniref:GIY-YIG nuclease family protein n=1 Tax=uncultured Christiangramia sp. TaxID=503836 RepID=UPI002639AB07|nr:hypothetical protein [uncultured Christiangramia sp.]